MRVIVYVCACALLLCGVALAQMPPIPNVYTTGYSLTMTYEPGTTIQGTIYHASDNPVQLRTDSTYPNYKSTQISLVQGNPPVEYDYAIVTSADGHVSCAVVHHPYAPTPVTCTTPTDMGMVGFNGQSAHAWTNTCTSKYASLVNTYYFNGNTPVGLMYTMVDNSNTTYAYSNYNINPIPSSVWSVPSDCDDQTGNKIKHNPSHDFLRMLHATKA